MATRKQVKIDFAKREKTGKGVCRKLRSKEQLPVVLYGPEYREGLPGLISAKAIMPVVNSEFKETTLIELVMEDGSVVNALIRDAQRHPLTQRLRHVDFYQVIKGHKIKVEIPIRVANKEIAPGIKDYGGLLLMNERSVTMNVMPKFIPDEIVVDAKDFVIGTEVFVRDLALPEEAEWITAEDTVVLSVIQPKIITEEEETAGTEEEAGEEAEVEVVAKGKAAKEEE